MSAEAWICKPFVAHTPDTLIKFLKERCYFKMSLEIGPVLQ